MSRQCGRESRTYLVFAIGMAAGFMLSILLRTFSNDVSQYIPEPNQARGNIYQYELASRTIGEDPSSNNDIEQLYQTQLVSEDDRSHGPPAAPVVDPVVDNDAVLELPPEQLILPKVEHPRLLGEVLPSRRALFVAILTTDKNLLSQTYAVQSTWAGEYDNVTFFVSKNSDVSRAPHFMNIVKLHDGGDDISEQHRRSLLVFHTIKYINDHLLQNFRWFMIVGDSTYVRTEQVEVLVNNYDDSYNIYLGRPNRHFNKKEEDMLYNANSHYCLLDSGIVMSRGLVRRLSPHLKSCIEKETTDLSYGGDWELGNCIQTYLDVKCTQAAETADLFFIDSSGQVFESSILFSNPVMQRALTLTPIRFPKIMYRLHLYYQELAYNQTMSKQNYHETEIRKSFPFVPTRLRSSFKISHDKKSDPSINDITKQMLFQPRFVPHNKWELHTWDYFNQTQLLQAYHNLPATGLIGVDRQEARNVLTKGMYLINKNRAPSERYGFERLENGYRRIDPSRGADYILDFVLNRQYGHGGKIHKRINLYHPFKDDFLVVSNDASPDTTVHFIVPLSGLSYRLVQFMKTYEINVLEPKEDATLTIVLSNGSDSEAVHDFLKQYQDNYPEAKINILDIYGEFARGVAIHKGLQLFSKYDLIFLCDVDIDVRWDFLRRCRLNTVRGRQVYFPIFFKLYKLDFVKQYGKASNASSTIIRQNGHWAHYSYGMVCLYGEDYQDTGGFDLTLQGWGEEDVSFLHRVIKSGKEVMRSPDPGLIHRWHPKHCSKSSIASDTVYDHCLRSKAENLADRIELANYYFEKEEQLL